MKLRARKLQVKPKNLVVLVCIGLAFSTATSSVYSKETATRPGSAKDSPIFSVDIDMNGFGCLGCIRRIERLLEQKSGVLKRVVTYEYGKGARARIIYDTRVVKLSDLVLIIDQETHEYKVHGNAPAKWPPSSGPAGGPESKPGAGKK